MLQTDNNDLNTTSSLAMNTLNNIPSPNQDASNIVALVKHSGKVTGYKLSDGRSLSKEEGVLLAKNGGINGVGISHRNGQEYLKSLPDNTENNNLSSLPTVSEKNNVQG